MEKIEEIETHGETYDASVPASEVSRLNIVLQNEREQHDKEYKRLRQTYIAESRNQDIEISALKRVSEEAEEQINTLNEKNRNLKRLYLDARDSNINYVAQNSKLKTALNSTLKPLGIENIRAMDKPQNSDWIWIAPLKWPYASQCSEPLYFHLCGFGNKQYIHENKFFYYYADYGKTWIAYNHKPEIKVQNA